MVFMVIVVFLVLMVNRTDRKTRTNGTYRQDGQTGCKGGTDRRDGQIRFLNLTLQAPCVGQLLQFLRGF